MKIPIRDIQHCNFSKAPFIGAVVTIGDKKQKKREVTDIMEEVLGYEGIALFQNSEPYFQIVEPSQEPSFQNPKPCFQKNEGLILEGAWEKYPLQLYEFLEIIGKNRMGLVVGIETKLADLEYNLGLKCSHKIRGKKDTDSIIISQEDKNVYNYMGAMLLDYHIPYDFYIKVGKNAGKKLTTNIDQFGVLLEYQKQYVIKMESRKEDIVNEN